MGSVDQQHLAIQLLIRYPFPHEVGKELDRGELGGTGRPPLLGEPSASSREETCTIVADRPGAVSQGAGGFSLLG